MKNKKCLVIGGSGFIGSELVRLLIASGRKVTVLGRRPESAAQVPQGCKYVSGDYGELSTLKSLLEEGQEIIDMAHSTVPKTSYSDPIFDIVSNLPVSVGLFQAAARVGAGKIVFCSSGGTVYGTARFLPITEEHPTEPVSPYGITKLAIDRYAMMFHKTMDLPVCVVRPANAYGECQKPGRGQGFLAESIDAVLRGREVQIFGETGSVRDYIHVRDVARGILAVLNCGMPGEVYNIGTGIGTSNFDALEIIRKLAKKMSLPVRCKIMPSRRFDVSVNILSYEKLKRHTGWYPLLSLEDGLENMWRHARFSE
jgi:UDP-glucose 4-epimerase